MDLKDKSIKDNLKEILSLKAQKLASATYLISGFIHDNDPLKWQLREQALAVAKELNPLTPELSLGLINQMTAYLDIALASQQVSEMNLSILKQEYRSLGELLLREKQPVINEPLPVFTPPIEPVKPAPTLTLTSIGQSESKASSFRPEAKLATPNQDRRSQILAYLKSHGESSIKDISGAVPAVSNKTVQRELSDLVRLGQVSREGDRRWSRYRLVP